MKTIEILAQRIHDEVYSKFYDYRTEVLICGAGAKAPNSVRQQIGQQLTSQFIFNRYEIFYPEDLFSELLTGPGHHDLVSLENILAESVDALILVVESYGAVAELGAFSSNSNLRKKLICVVDSQYKKDKSFINFGPLRLIRSTNEGSIVYGDFSDVTSMMEHIRRAISKSKKTGSPVANVKNVVQAHHYILASIFLFQTVTRDQLIELVNIASKTDTQNARALTTGALSILNKNREIELSPDGYHLTIRGMEHFKTFGRRGKTKRSINLGSLDQIRIDILNWKYRGKLLRS